jgi:hypothetical protein
VLGIQSEVDGFREFTDRFVGDKVEYAGTGDGTIGDILILLGLNVRMLYVEGDCTDGYRLGQYTGN